MSKSIGDRGEALAIQYLTDQGFEFIANNYRCRRGEIDIVTAKAGQYVFVEVKYRENQGFGEASEYVTHSKLRKIKIACENYLFEHQLLNSPWRVDVIAIDRATGELLHIENVLVEGFI